MYRVTSNQGYVYTENSYKTFSAKMINTGNQGNPFYDNYQQTLYSNGSQGNWGY